MLRSRIFRPLTLPGNFTAKCRLAALTCSSATVISAIPRWPPLIYLYVPDADATYQRALSLGATSVREPKTETWGDRVGGVKDTSGDTWWIATNKPAELRLPDGNSKRADDGRAAGLALYQIGVGHYFSRALALAAKLGVGRIFSKMVRVTIEDLAAATKTHPPSLNRVLRLLASIGVFEEREGGIFALTPMAELLRTGVPGSMRSSVQLFAGVGIQDSWKELEYCIQTGEPAFRRHSPDSDPFVQIAQNPEMAKSSTKRWQPSLRLPPPRSPLRTIFLHSVSWSTSVAAMARCWSEF